MKLRNCYYDLVLLNRRPHNQKGKNFVERFLLLLLLQPTQTNFKQQQPQQQHKTTQFKYENGTKMTRLHFCDLRYISISYMPHRYATVN